MFPVLVTLDNREGLLKPGMNGEVTVLVDRRENVLSIPNDAVRTTREAAATATLLNLNPDSVVAAVQAQMGAAGGNGAGLGMNGGNGRAMESRGDVAVELLASQGRGGQGRQGMPEVTDADCQKVRDAFARAPSAQTTLQGLRGRMQGGEIDQARLREISDSIYKAVGLDGMVARGCQARDRAAQGGANRGGSSGDVSGPASTPTTESSRGGRSGRGGRRGGSNVAALAGMDVPISQARRAPARASLVYVAAGSTFVPRVIHAGMSDLDFTEVVSGLEEGEQVVLLSALSMQARRDSAMQRMRARSGGGLPGAPGGGGGGRGRGF
jgi:hypothetical protein